MTMRVMVGSFFFHLLIVKHSIALRKVKRAGKRTPMAYAMGPLQSNEVRNLTHDGYYRVETICFFKLMVQFLASGA